MDLNKLITQIEEWQNKRSLSDEYLAETGSSTREDVGVGEYVYGIVMVPEDWVLPYLKELRDDKAKKNNSTAE